MAQTSSAHAPEGVPDLSHRQIMTIIAGLITGMMLAALDQSIVGTALPRIVSDLGGLNHLAWVVTAYLLTSTAVTPLWGKISDLYGRRIIFQTAIIIFLIGSALCGLAQNMPQLIAFRAIQGIGGGGLMAIAFAIIGDVIPARERGRYQGYFGAVFGLSSIAGPLLGGWLTDAVNWRWIFYINLPLGLFALVITSMALKMPVVKRNHKIDYLGASVIVAAVTSLLLYLNWAGEHYGWSDPRALAFIGASALLAVAFVFIEIRIASEPIIPMRLFRNPIFSVGNSFSFFVGFAMFGGAIYLPLFFQAVMGMSPTRSGLAMLPMVAGMFSMSITSGLLITKTGKYKIFPIVGCCILIVAMFLLSTIQYDTPYWHIALFAFCFGIGLGLAMMTIVTPVQNAIEFRDMGVATSTITFVRSLGGAIGVALFGAIMNSRLTTYLSDELGSQVSALSGGEINTNDVQALQTLQEPIRTEVLTAYTHAITDIYLLSIPIIVVALVVVLFLKEIPLRTRVPEVANSSTSDNPDVEIDAAMASMGH